MTAPQALSSSFRDPNGFLFRDAGVLYRQVNLRAREDFDRLIDSGLYDELVDAGLLIAHDEVATTPFSDEAYKVLRPQRIPIISYPYEWSFSQLKDAALLTLRLQERAMRKGLSLKDASAFNVQFSKAAPVFIDTLSFERWQPDRPWVAYKQFCEHFLAPLTLMAKTDISLNQLARTNIDGVPLGLASRLLPWRTRLSFSSGVHLHLHARAQRANAASGLDKDKGNFRRFSSNAFFGLIDSLRRAVEKLAWTPAGTEWADYDTANHNYTEQSRDAKSRLVDEWMARARPGVTWDLGANTGRFSALAARHSEQVCAWDIDPACVELHYRRVRGTNEPVLPLLLDLASPSPALGWHHRERMSLLERGPADMALALGLVHHLAISNNLPFDRIVDFIADVAPCAIVEFVPRSDSQVARLLATREDIFDDYHQPAFERAFARRFTIEASEAIPDSERTLYLFARRSDAPG